MRMTIYLNIALIFLVTSVLAFEYRFSSGSKVAARAVFESDEVNADFGQVDRILLISSSWKYSGQSACADLGYLVFGAERTGTVKVRVAKVQSKSVVSWVVLDLVENAWGASRVACR